MKSKRDNSSKVKKMRLEKQYADTRKRNNTRGKSRNKNSRNSGYNDNYDSNDDYYDYD